MWVNNFFDYVIVNDQDVAGQQLDKYLAEGAMPITPDIDKIRQLGITVVPARLISKKILYAMTRVSWLEY